MEVFFTNSSSAAYIKKYKFISDKSKEALWHNSNISFKWVVEDNFKILYYLLYNDGTKTFIINYTFLASNLLLSISVKDCSVIGTNIIYLSILTVYIYSFLKSGLIVSLSLFIDLNSQLSISLGLGTYDILAYFFLICCPIISVH